MIYSMIIEYGNFTHILTIAITILLILFTYLILRKAKKKTQQIVVLVLMLLNVFQHFFKFIVWPHYYGRGFGIENTAYNMCALLILLSPLTFVFKNESFKEYISLLGFISGSIAISVPYWFVNSRSSIVTFEYLRFYFCHSVLAITSIVPLLLGLNEIKFKHFYKIGLFYFLSILIINTNNFVFYYIKYSFDLEKAINLMTSSNPVWSFRPPTEFPIFGKIMQLFSPKILMDIETNYYVPILYYFIPMYSFITISAFILSIIVDRKTFRKR